MPTRSNHLLSLAAVLVLAGSLSAAEPRVLFEDRFDGKLGDGWTWLREDAKTWRLRDAALEIRVEPGVATTVKNALLRKAPDRSKGKFAAEVTVTHTAAPTKQFEQLGITFYQNEKPGPKLVHELIDGKTYIIPGKVPTETKSVQLRVVMSKEELVFQFRPDGKGEFRTVGVKPLPAAANEQISIQCYQGPADAEHWMRFDDFRLIELPQ